MKNTNLSIEAQAGEYSNKTDTSKESQEDALLELESYTQIREQAAVPEIYTESAVPQILGLLSGSFLAAHATIDKILDNIQLAVHAKRIEQLLPPHAIQRTFCFSEKAVFQHIIRYDELEEGSALDGIVEDEEPGCVEQEHWRRNIINVEKKEAKPEESKEISDDAVSKNASMYSSKKKFNFKKFQHQGSIGSEKNIKSPTPLQQKQEIESKIVDMSKPREFDHEEESLRVIKER